MCFLKKIIKDAFIFAFSILLIIYLNNCIHCVVNRQHLVKKHLNTSLHLSLTIIIQAVNKIKSNAKNDRIFRQLCQDNNEYFIYFCTQKSGGCQRL